MARNARPEPEIEIRLSSSYSIERLDRLIKSLAPLLALEEPAVVRLDLSGLVFLAPTATALVTAVLKKLYEGGLFSPGSMLRHPKSPAVRNYVSRMDILQVIGFEDDHGRHDAVGFRACRPFSTRADAGEVARDLTNAIVENCDDVDDLARYSINVCLSELAENVVDHADTSMGFAAAQGFASRNTVEIGIVDLGIGIQASLKKNQNYVDIDGDIAAIEKALEPRVSSTPDRNGGIGLFVTKLLLRANGGVLAVRSGEGIVYAGAEQGGQAAPVAFPGTLVALRARTDQPLNIKQIYGEHLPLDDDERIDA